MTVCFLTLTSDCLFWLPPPPVDGSPDGGLGGLLYNALHALSTLAVPSSPSSSPFLVLRSVTGAAAARHANKANNKEWQWGAPLTDASAAAAGEADSAVSGGPCGALRCAIVGRQGSHNLSLVAHALGLTLGPAAQGGGGGFVQCGGGGGGSGGGGLAQFGGVSVGQLGGSGFGSVGGTGGVGWGRGGFGQRGSAVAGDAMAVDSGFSFFC
ncbi:hypothetical protein T492DRAFT_838677 [Pavlovales sp. CCMP2436]|nr:hypothetical protein T492DRAFT_838677 [Pavlovales sp. CCMP2436]